MSLKIDLSRDELLEDYAVGMLKDFYLKEYETSPQEAYSRAAKAWSTYKDELDEDKFVTEFTNAVIKDWKGLALEHLETLLLVDISKEDPTKELEYSRDNAETLVSSSAEFDTWLNEVVFDLDNFRSEPKESTPRKTGKVLQEQ